MSNRPSSSNANSNNPSDRFTMATPAFLIGPSWDLFSNRPAPSTSLTPTRPLTMPPLPAEIQLEILSHLPAHSRLAYSLTSRTMRSFFSRPSPLARETNPLSILLTPAPHPPNELGTRMDGSLPPHLVSFYELFIFCCARRFQNGERAGRPKYNLTHLACNCCGRFLPLEHFSDEFAGRDHRFRPNGVLARKRACLPCAMGRKSRSQWMCNALELNALPRARVDGECEHVYERVAMTETERANWKEEVWRWCWTVRGVGWMFCGPHERAWTHKAGLRFDTVKGLGQCRRARAFDRCNWSRMNMRERNVSVRFVEGKVWIMCCRCTRVSDRGVWNREQSRGWCRDCFGSSAYTGEMQLEDINVDTKPKVKKKKGPLDEKLQTGFGSLSISANEPRPETEERMLEPMPKQFRPEEWDDNEETLVWNEAPKPKGNGKKRSGDEDVVPDAPRKRRR